MTERPEQDGHMSCPCGRGDYGLCSDCPYTWCSVHGRTGNRDVPVEYACTRCGNSFIVMQAQGGRDDDITLCWDCIGRLLEGRPLKTGLPAE